MMKNRIQASDKTALDTALSLLSRRQVTVFQLRQRLQEKGFTQQDIEETVQRLISWKYLNDYSYATAYIKSRRNKLSKKKIFIALLQVGIEKELSGSLLDELCPEDKEYENCLKLALKFWEEEDLKWEKKYKFNPKNKTIPKVIFLKKKIGDKLLLRGFLITTVKSVLAEVLKREDF